MLSESHLYNAKGVLTNSRNDLDGLKSMLSEYLRESC
jgi:hypothetical protein